MDLSALSDSELMLSLKDALATERCSTLSLLYHLMEVEKRGSYREAGFSSLYDFCVRGLQLSEGGAYRRITAARAMREHSELPGLFLEGKVSLCSIAVSAKAIKEEAASVSDIVGKSKREVERLIAVPESKKPRERIRPVITGKASSSPISSAIPAPEEKKEERFELKFSVTKEVFEEFEALRDELSNKLGQDLSLEAVFSEVVKAQRVKNVPKPRVPSLRKNKSSRRIPASVKREVLERDNHQCTYCAEDGTRCSERRYLQFDHIVPFARGGSSEASNLRILCAGHNRMCAEESFGREKVDFYSNLHR